MKLLNQIGAFVSAILKSRKENLITYDNKNESQTKNETHLNVSPKILMVWTGILSFLFALLDWMIRHFS